MIGPERVLRVSNDAVGVWVARSIPSSWHAKTQRASKAACGSLKSRMLPQKARVEMRWRQDHWNRAWHRCFSPTVSVLGPQQTQQHIVASSSG